MKFHTITLEGVGSFYESTTLDLEELSESGLFLITGNTGAGKSTILDGIVYALYGEVSGDKDSTSSRLLSMLWDKDYPPQVTLVFSANDKFYRAHRTVTFTKPNRKTPTRTEAELQIATDIDFTKGLQSLSGTKTVDDAILNVLGLERTHFLQTVILPQGQVQQFLTAKADQKHEVLLKLFNAERFTALEEAAKDSAQSGKKSLEEHLQRQNELLLALCDTLQGADISEERAGEWKEVLEDFAAARNTAQKSVSALNAAAAPLFVATEGLLAKEQDALQATVAKARKQFEADKSRLTLAQAEAKTISTAQEMTKTLTQLLQNEKVMQELDLRNQEATRANEVIEAAKTVERPLRSARHTVADILDSLDTLTGSDPELAEFKPRVSTLSAQEVPAWLKQDTLTQDLGMLRDEMADRTQVIHQKLQTVRDNITERQNHESTLEQTQTQLETTIEEIAELKLHSNATKESLTKAQEALESNKNSAGLLSVRSKNFDLAKRTHESALEAKELQETVAKLQKTISQLEEKHRLAQTKSQDLLQDWSNTEASRLAAHLTAGEPCPVCGSKTHPQPAPQVTGAASFADYQKAEEVAQKAFEKLTAAVQKKTGLEAKYEQVTKHLQGQDLEATAKALDQAKELVLASTKAQELIPKLEKNLALLEDRRNQEEASGEALIKKETTLRTEVKNLEARISTLDEKIRQDLGVSSTNADPQKMLNTNQQSLTIVKQLGRHFDSWLQIRQEWLSTNEALEKTLKKQGFTSLEAAKSLAKTPNELESDVKTVKEYHQLLTDLRAKLDTDAYRGKADAEMPDLEGIRATSQESETAYARLKDRQVRILSTQENLSHSQSRFDQNNHQWRKQQQNFEVLQRLSDVLNGDNPLQTSLSGYYLSKRLGQVVEVANQLIFDISGGNYEIRHNDKAETDRNRRYHRLGIEMYNGAEDKVIPPNSLSGGEKFYCSLSMALALSEVVQQERGGIKLENIFIDEGFGTLDDNTRESVMNALHRLHQEGGRSVGIISHITELLEEIPTQVEVVNYHSGDPAQTREGAKKKRGSYLTVRGLRRD